jgi:hypothetical protein
VNDDNGVLLADTDNILNWWKKHFSQLLNVHRFGDVRQAAIHAAEPLRPDPSPSEAENYVAKFKMYNWSDSDQFRHD